MFMKAKVTPTAKASILVAMASISIVYGLREGLQLPLASRDSFIILRPMALKRMKVIQWS